MGFLISLMAVNHLEILSSYSRHFLSIYWSNLLLSLSGELADIVVIPLFTAAMGGLAMRNISGVCFILGEPEQTPCSGLDSMCWITASPQGSFW